ncbi:MAG: PCMD domain-containing protein [Dysgonamonadaceae bacterium]|jgi:hypothetical protein|nr:PCMD domain-containing protein [Dysgonamonadaceae bacterium]
MNRIYLSLILAPFLMASCIKDTPLNPEADILSFTYPKQYMRTESPEIYNRHVVVYPNAGVDLTTLQYSISVTPGATYEEIRNQEVSDTLFFIQVRSENKENTKPYAIIQVPDTFPDIFRFENWVKYAEAFMYENPKDGSYQWFSSNNGAAFAIGSQKPASEYPVTKAVGLGHDGSTAVKLSTLVGPGTIEATGTTIPCLSGSVFLGGFNLLTALRDPLSSIKFGVPFRKGKPLRLKGYYKYTEGSSPFIVDKNTSDANRRDSCDIYAVLFRTGDPGDDQVLDGNTVGTSLQRIARAGLSVEQRWNTPGNGLVSFDIPFVYFNETDSRYPAFSEADLQDNKYKITIVCASSYKGDYYQGRPGSTLLVDDIQVICAP